MRLVLHILTRPPEPWVKEMIAHQQTLPETRVEVFDLTQPGVDYDTLMQMQFEADSVAVW